MRIPTDKLLHIMAGYIIALTIGLFSPAIGFIAASVIGAAKELIWDKAMKKGTPETADFLCTVCGAAVAWVILVITK